MVARRTKSARMLVVAALAVAALGLGASPASAGTCDPDGICPDCNSNPTVSMLWRKVFGYEPECA